MGADECLAISHRGRVNCSVGRLCHRCDFALRHLVEYESVARGRDTQDQSARFGAQNQIPLQVDGKRAYVRFVALEKYFALAIRGDSMQFALISSGNEEIARRIEASPQMYFALGS